jgi:hypothetical protein
MGGRGTQPCRFARFTTVTIGHRGSGKSDLDLTQAHTIPLRWRASAATCQASQGATCAPGLPKLAPASTAVWSHSSVRNRDRRRSSTRRKKRTDVEPSRAGSSTCSDKKNRDRPGWLAFYAARQRFLVEPHLSSRTGIARPAARSLLYAVLEGARRDQRLSRSPWPRCRRRLPGLPPQRT